MRKGSIVTVASLALLALSCALTAPSEQEIRAEFTKFVQTHNACTVAADCKLIAPDCPLGCTVAVQSSQAGAVEAKAKDLIADYESGGRACAYNCALTDPVSCEAGHCAPGPMLQ